MLLYIWLYPLFLWVCVLLGEVAHPLSDCSDIDCLAVFLFLFHLHIPILWFFHVSLPDSCSYPTIAYYKAAAVIVSCFGWAMSHDYNFH